MYYCGGGELGNCPEIAHCHCPPPTNCPFSASRFDWKENSGLWSSIRKYSRSYRVSWHAEAANYELNQAWNAPISCFRPCLMVKINYCHASEVIIIIIISRQANSGVPIKDAFAKEFRQKCLFSVTVRLTIRVDALRWGFRDFLGVHSTQQYDQHLCVDHACIVCIGYISEINYTSDISNLSIKEAPFITRSSFSRITLATASVWGNFTLLQGWNRFSSPLSGRLQFSNTEQTSVMERI